MAWMMEQASLIFLTDVVFPKVFISIVTIFVYVCVCVCVYLFVTYCIVTCLVYYDHEHNAMQLG